MDTQMEPAGAAEGPEAAVDAAEERRWVAAAIAALPAKERAAVAAHDLEGETFVAMAARIGGGVAESTVRGWRDAGIRRLRVCISEMPRRHVSKKQR